MKRKSNNTKHHILVTMVKNKKKKDVTVHQGEKLPSTLVSLCLNHRTDGPEVSAAKGKRSDPQSFAV